MGAPVVAGLAPNVLSNSPVPVFEVAGAPKVFVVPNPGAVDANGVAAALLGSNIFDVCPRVLPNVDVKPVVLVWGIPKPVVPGFAPKSPSLCNNFILF